MKKLYSWAGLIFLFSALLNAEQTITDMAGRTVTLPEPNEIETVFAANPIASVFLYTVDMDRMAGWNVNLYKDSKPLFPARVRNLPHYGTLYGNGKSISEEEVFAADPQFILLMGELTEPLKRKADELTSRFGLPVVVLDNDLYALSPAYSLMGVILGCEERTDELSLFCANILERAGAVTASIPPGQRKTVFYSLDSDGLKTYPKNTSLSSYMEMCGAENVVDLPTTKKLGHMSVSFEQLVSWDPEYILAGSFANSPANSGSVYNQTRWKALAAQVVMIPYVPFDTFAKPPSVNRIAGIIWLQNLLYPELADYDLDEEIGEFNRLFYSIEY